MRTTLLLRLNVYYCRFISNSGISLRPSWKVFRNAFAAWFFDLDQSTVQEYLEKAAKENVDSENVYQYSWVSPRSIVFSVIHYLLSNQLVMARKPVTISEASIGFQGLGTAIEEAIAGADEGEKGN